MGTQLITKKPNWVSLLGSFIEANRNTPFEYGEFDCCLAVCDAIEVITGIDPAEDFRGKYNSKAGAIKFITSWNGVEGIADEVSNNYGLEEVDPHFAGRGDVVLIKNEEHALGMISTCGRKVFAAGKDGLKFVSKKEIVRAWRIE